MSIKYLAVDNDIKLAHIYAELWAERGIIVEHVDNMAEGIEKLLSNKDYLFIGINSDGLDIMPLLSTMRSLTYAPLLIATGHYTMEMDIAALEAGADLFGRWQETEEGNISSVLAHITQITNRNKIKVPRAKVESYNGILVKPEQKSVLIQNTEIQLSPKEFALFHILISEKGRIFPYKTLYEAVWESPYNENEPNDVIWTVMTSLRQKLQKFAQSSYYIKTTRELGYSFHIK